VDTAREFADKYIEVPAAVIHSHGPGSEHSHGGTAFTTWLDFSQAAQQAEAVAQAVSCKRPELKGQIERNLAALKSDLLAFDARIAKIVGSNPGRPLMASHPVYQYLARRYGLNLRSVLWDPDSVPTKEQWDEFERILSEHPAKWMLWQGEPSKENVERLRALGVQSVVINPCAKRPASGDFMSVMEHNIRELEEVFARTDGTPRH
jgi:zinc transport system substrate-binding protein